MRGRWVILVVILVVLVTFPLKPVRAQSVTSFITRAIDLYYEGRYREALGELDRALRVQANSATVHLWIGVVYAESGLDNGRAVAELRKTLELAPLSSVEAAQAQRWLLRLQGRPRGVIIAFFPTEARYDQVNATIVDGITRQIVAGGTYSYEVAKGAAGGGRDALLNQARARGAGWVLRGVLRRVSVDPNILLRGSYCGAINLDVTLIDAVLGNDMAAFDGGEGTCDTNSSRALENSVSRTGSAIWPKVSNLIRVSDERVQDELNRLSIRLKVPNVYAFAARMDRQTANALPRVVVPAFRSSGGAMVEPRDDLTDLFTRLLIAPGRFAVVPETELSKYLKTRGDSVDEESLVRAARATEARYLILGDLARLEVKSQFALIGTRIEVDSAIRLRVLKSDGAALGEVASAKKASSVMILRSEGQVKDQVILFRGEVFRDLSKDLVDKFEALIRGGPVINPIAPSPVIAPSPQPPAPAPEPAPTNREGR